MLAKLDRRQSYFALGAALLALLLVAAATWAYGFGASTDSVYYLSTADNLAAGQGVRDFKGNELVTWPPLLPLLIGGLRWATGAASLAIGGALNLVCSFCIVLVASRLLAAAAFKQQLWVYFGTALTAIFAPFLFLASNIATDPLFILLTLLFLFLMQRYRARPNGRDLLLAALAVGAAAVLRWTGVVLIVVGNLFLVWQHWGDWRRWWRANLGFGALASLPFLGWVIGRNYLQVGTLLGPRDTSTILPWENLLFSLERMQEWLLPHALTKRVPVLILVAIGLGLMIWLSRRGGWGALRLRLLSGPQSLLLAFSVVYLAFITFTTFTGDHIDAFDDRYQAPLFVPLLVLVLTLLDEAVWPHLRRVGRILLLGGLALWLGYQGFLSLRFMRTAMQSGVPYYNIYNSPEYRQSDLIQALDDFDFGEGLAIYSNNAAAVYFYSGAQVHNSLNDPVNFEASSAYLQANVQAWPPQPEAYLVWFADNWKQNYFSPEQIEMVSDLDLLLEAEDGAIYRAVPQQSN